MPKSDAKRMRRRIANAYLSSVLSISLVLLLIGIASLVLINAGSVSRHLKENMKVSVIFKSDVDESRASAYETRIAMLPYVRSTDLVSRERGERELAEMLGEDFLTVFEVSAVPVSLDISLQAEYVHPDSLRFITGRLADSPMVEEVDSRENLVEALNSNIARISAVFAVFIALLLFISFVLINNMVRLSVFARRFTIHTMKLVGATRGFIMGPFLRKSLVQGMVSALIACAVIWAAITALKKSFPQLYSVFDSSSMYISTAVVFACGILICLLSTLFVVNKLISASKDDLYY